MESLKNANEIMEFLKKAREIIGVFRQNSDENGDLLRLDTTLARARQLIERSECWRFRHQPVDKLLLLLKASAYEAEIILEEFEYRKQTAATANWIFVGKFVNNFKKWLIGFPDNVRNAQVNANNVCDELERLCNDLNIPTNPNQFSSDARPETTEDLPDSVVYGRDNELNYAIRLLGITRSGPGIGDSSSTEERKNVSVLPIVGVGGVGKTTLAQKIYNTVKSNFHLQIWICVSDKWDIKDLTKQMLEAVGANEKERSQTNLNNLQQSLQQKFKSKKVLLVLDDIWSKDWLPVLRPIKEASQGSAVILTSRSLEAVEYTGTNMNSLGPIELEGLEKKVYWDFFMNCAGLEVGSENYNQLKKVAEEICEKLKGSPLAAKTLGGILRKNFDNGYWMNIRDSKMWELEQGEQDIFPILQLSYQHLPSHLKKCFSFCSLFPKDHKFTENELTRLWILEDFIPKRETLKQMEDLALNFFHDLVNRCFFQREPYVMLFREKKYVIHDLMHDVSQSATKDECHCLDGNFKKISPDVQHLMVFDKNLKLPELKELGKFRKLRSLIVAHPHNCGIQTIKSWFNDLMTIRSLSLAKCKVEKLPDNIGNLKHLHYLDISDTKIKIIPKSFCSLYNLRYLDMRGCSSIKDFPDSCHKLSRLQFFRPPVHLVPLISQKPELLNAIQNYNLIFPVKDDGKVANLKHLSGIRGFLEITELDKVPSKQAAQEAGLCEQEHLDLLHLNWHPKFFDGALLNIKSIHEEVLDGLHPHHNIKELEIINYQGENFSPSWIGENSLNLRRVLFHRWFINPRIINLPSSITELDFTACLGLTSLQSCLQPDLLPNLKILNIKNCSLKSLPVESFNRFLFLEKLHINDCLKLTCPQNMVLAPSVKELFLAYCGELENSIPSCLQNLTSLTLLKISGFQRLKSIPEEVMRDLKSLRSLGVYSCKVLQSLGEAQFPTSLKHLDISSCSRLKLTRGQNYNGIPFSGPATQAVALSSSHASLTTPEMQLTETPSIVEAVAASSSHPALSTFETQLTETLSIGVPSTSNVRKRKACARK